VENGKEELQRRARERAERAALSGKLDELSEKVIIGGDLPQDAAESRVDIDVWKSI